MYAAKKYQLPKLIGECQRVLQTNISTDNVCVILDQAIIFEEQNLFNKTIDFVGRNAHAVILTDAFAVLSREGLLRIVSYDNLQVEEAILYRACLRWALVQLSLGRKNIENVTDEAVRKTIGDILYRIRFPTMTLTEFAASGGQGDVLTCSEKSSIYHYIATTHDVIATIDDVSNSLKFDRKYRHIERYATRFTSTVSQKWGCNGQPDAIQFSSNHAVRLTAIGTYGISAPHDTIALKVDVTRHPSDVWIGGTGSYTANYSNLTNDGETLRIPLDVDIEIKPDILYTIKLSPAMNRGYRICYRAYGTGGQALVSSPTQNVLFQFRNSAIPEGTSTTVGGGQIPLLYYIQ